MQLFPKRRIFSEFFLHFLKLGSIFNILKKKKKTLTADVFLNLRTPKNVARKMPKNSRFRGPVDK